jgi:hypothetical protein
MTDHAPPSRVVYVVALTGVVLVVALTAGALSLAVLNRSDLSQLTFLLTTPVAALVGWLIATRRPANPIGWCILGHAVCFSLGEFARQYALFGLATQPGALPFAYSLASVSYWIWGPGIALGFTLWLLVFPDGRLVSPAWRLVVWYVVVVTVLATALQAVLPGDQETPGIPNPLGIEALAGLGSGPLVALQLLWLSTAIIALASIIVRYRRATMQERQQIRWPAYAVGIALTVTVLDRFVPFPLPELVIVFTLGGIWVAIAISILRHRLFDIDVIIKRTLVYALLSGTLIAVYFASVVLLQQVFRVVTGQESDLAVVASTLAIAVLFQPLRRRIQAFIDRRFHRRAYDADAILAAHGAMLRDEVDPHRLTGELLGVVGETVQPAHASLWLRQPEDGQGRGAGRSPGEE